MSYTVRWLGQGGFLFRLGGKTLVIDPYLSDSVAQTDHFSRIIPIPIQPEALSCDMVICTHDHQDHLDADTMAKTSLPLYAGPNSCIAHFRALGIEEARLQPLNVGETVSLGEARLTALYARHTEDSIGVLIDYRGVKLYVTGDTEYDERLLEAAGCDVSILFICINGRLGNMNARDAARVAQGIRCRLAVPMHYGMFAENTEDPAAFVEALEGKAPSFIMDFDAEYDVEQLLSQIP
ncbi:MAG: MBL fold metallo-hydrolase [Clostridia bacterium]|nr:MBL fold metallo-hydrolase [Clostridia bacterium]